MVVVEEVLFLQLFWKKDKILVYPPVRNGANIILHQMLFYHSNEFFFALALRHFHTLFTLGKVKERWRNEFLRFSYIFHLKKIDAFYFICVSLALLCVRACVRACWKIRSFRVQQPIRIITYTSMSSLQSGGAARRELTLLLILVVLPWTWDLEILDVDLGSTRLCSWLSRRMRITASVCCLMLRSCCSKVLMWKWPSASVTRPLKVTSIVIFEECVCACVIYMCVCVWERE